MQQSLGNLHMKTIPFHSGRSVHNKDKDREKANSCEACDTVYATTKELRHHHKTEHLDLRGTLSIRVLLSKERYKQSVFV